jgi:hypothetical protein
MLYILVFLVGLAVVAIALLRESTYVAGVSAFATTVFFIVLPAYHFFTWATPWLIVTTVTLVWAIRSRSTWSRVALITSAGILITLTVGASKWTLLLTLIAVIFTVVEGERGTKLWKLLATASVAVATLAMAMSGNLVAPSIFGTAVAADATPQDLTIKPGELLPDAAKCGTDDKFNRNSMPETKGRVWSDSVSTPFKSTTKDAQFKELTSEICVNPVLGDAYIKALSDAKIGDFSVAQANPWMKEFTDKSKDGLKVWLTHKASDPKGFYVTNTGTGNYQYYAQMTNAVLYVLDNQGPKTATSTVNWPLGSLVVDTLPRVYKETRPNKQENLPFMALTFTQKAGGCPYVLGVNLKDKRPENVSCKKAKEIAPPTPTKRKPPTVTPPPGKGGSTPTPSGTPTKPGHTPTPTPSHSTKPPKSCPPGQSGNPCLETKDPKPIPTNEHHTPAGQHTESAKPPVHPSHTATTGTAGSESTQQAEGSTPKPKPSETAPHAGNPTSTATACVPDPDSGKSC